MRYNDCLDIGASKKIGIAFPGSRVVGIEINARCIIGDTLSRLQGPRVDRFESQVIRSFHSRLLKSAQNIVIEELSIQGALL